MLYVEFLMNDGNVKTVDFSEYSDNSLFRDELVSYLTDNDDHFYNNGVINIIIHYQILLPKPIKKITLNTQYLEHLL